jgi:hypothetical protein
MGESRQWKWAAIDEPVMPKAAALATTFPPLFDYWLFVLAPVVRLLTLEKFSSYRAVARSMYQIKA